MADRVFSQGSVGVSPLMESIRTLERLKKLRQAARDSWQTVQSYTTVPKPPEVQQHIPVPESAYDEARIGDLMVGQTANVLTNENRALSGPKLDEGIYAMGRAIINRDLLGQARPRNPGVQRFNIASTNPPPRLSPQEAAQAKRNLEIARKAFIDTKLGEPDPVQGSISYNHRDVRDAVPRSGRPPAPRYGEPVLRSYGPLHNAQPSNKVGQQAYITIYRSPQRYLNPYERKKK